MCPPVRPAVSIARLLIDAYVELRPELCPDRYYSAADQLDWAGEKVRQDRVVVGTR